MEDLFKKFVNAGVGYLAQGNKKVQDTIDSLVKDSKLTEQEGKKIVDDLLKSGETRRAALEKEFKGLTNRLRSSVGLPGTAKPAAKGKAKPAAGSTSITAKSVVKSANSVASKVAGAAKTAADKVSAAAESVQRSTAAKAAAKPAVKAPAKPTAKAAAKPAAKAAAKAIKPAAKKAAPAAEAPAADNA